MGKSRVSASAVCSVSPSRTAAHTWGDALRKAPFEVALKLAVRLGSIDMPACCVNANDQENRAIARDRRHPPRTGICSRNESKIRCPKSDRRIMSRSEEHTSELQ